MRGPLLPPLLSARLPFSYGWVVLGVLCCAGFARQGPAVATLSIFIEPLVHEFGWSRTALSGAVSLGGLLAAVAAPLIGPMLDRRGSRLVLCAAVLTNGAALLLLSLTPSLLVFYLLFCLARMSWAAPFNGKGPPTSLSIRSWPPLAVEAMPKPLNNFLPRCACLMLRR